MSASSLLRIVLLTAGLVVLESSGIAATGDDYLRDELSSRVCGIVTDPQGAPVPNARVTISRVGVESRDLETGNSGTFVFDKVELGVYELQVEAPGFSTQRSRIRIVSRRRKCQRPVRIALQIGPFGNPVVEPPMQACCCGRSGGAITGGAFRVGGPVSAPRLISSVRPRYTEEARKAGIRGTVVLWVLVEPDGCPSAVRVARPLGAGLDEQAIAAVRCWKYEPAKKDGQPVRVEMLIDIPFDPSDPVNAP